jgi:hypothetical protein
MWQDLTPSLNASYKINKNSEIGMEYIFGHEKSGMDILNTTRNISSDLTKKIFYQYLPQRKIPDAYFQHLL